MTQPRPRSAFRRFGVAGQALLLSVVLTSREAAGQTSTTAAAGETSTNARDVQPPELVHFEPAQYPAEAWKAGLQANVVLALDIDENGQVTKTEVPQPAGHGFDEAAQKAALKLVFKPARKRERPIKARILFQYSFHSTPAPAEPEEVKPKLARLSGTVTITGGTAPVAGAKLTILRDAKLISELQADPHGHFELGDLEPGQYDVIVEADGFEVYQATENCVAGEETIVAYAISPVTENISIVVEGAHPPREVTRRSMTRRELSRIPGTSGDALRALQNLPGVARPPALSGLLVVRGNADRTTPVLVDGLWVPNIYHFGGLSSVIPTEMLDEVNFYPGNFSVRYGRALAGVVDAHLRETRQDNRYHGLVQLDLIDARAMLEGPVPFAKNWNFIGGFRRSHVDAWLAPLLEDRNTDIKAAPVYYDYQLIFDNRPTDNSYLRIGFIGFDDRFRLVNQSAATSGQFDTINSTYGAGIIYDNQLSENIKFHLTLTAARNRVRFAVSTTEFDTTAYGNILRSEISWHMRPGVTLRTGIDSLLAPFKVNGQFPEAAAANAPSTNSPLAAPAQVFNDSGLIFFPAIYGEMDMRPSRRMQVVSGVRADYTLQTGRVDVAPRLTARYDIVPNFPRTTLKAGSGFFFQAPDLIELVLKDKDTDLRSQRSFQNSLGVEQQLSNNLKFSVEGFFNLLDNLITRSPSADGRLRYNNNGRGRIFGSEFMLRYEADDHFFGWISYTLSRSERTWVPGGPSELFYLDQTHILTALGSYDLGKGWEIGLRFRYVTGNLYTPCTGSIFSGIATSYLCINGPQFSKRLPPFNQLDLRIDKRWKFSNFSLSAYLDLINAYNRKNPDFIQYSYDYTASQAQTGSLPIVPSLGLRGEF
ncbi:MAG: TonB family protein [Myxococcota bacterium]